MIGTWVPFMVLRQDGSLEVQHSESLIEGLTIAVKVDRLDTDHISIKELNIRNSRVISRQEIPGVPFDVGRPLVHSMEVSCSLVLDPRHVGIIPLPREFGTDPTIVVFLAAREHVTND